MARNSSRKTSSWCCGMVKCTRQWPWLSRRCWAASIRCSSSGERPLPSAGALRRRGGRESAPWRCRRQAEAVRLCPVFRTLEQDLEQGRRVAAGGDRREVDAGGGAGGAQLGSEGEAVEIADEAAGRRRGRRRRLRRAGPRAGRGTSGWRRPRPARIWRSGPAPAASS